jgi:hypothetical protein
LPNYAYTFRGRKAVVVGAGLVTGVQVTLRKDQSVALIWQIPNMLVYVALVLVIIMTGFVPGLLLILLMWLVIREDVEKIKLEIADVIGVGGSGGVVVAGPPNWGSVAQGSPVQVQGSDGQGHSAGFVRWQEGHVLCSFPNGQQEWYPEALVSPPPTVGQPGVFADPSSPSHSPRSKLGSRVLAGVFAVLGLLIGLVATDFLTHTGEGELVQASYGLCGGIGGVLGALIGGENLRKATILSLAFSFVVTLLLFFFIVAIFPSL